MESTSAAEILGLARWPFNLSPNEHTEICWADREQLEHQVRRLFRRLTRHDNTSLHLLWADFGAGKSHTLLYLRQLALLEAPNQVLPVYIKLPEATKSFKDLYRACIRGIGLDVLEFAYTSALSDTQNRQHALSIMNEALLPLPAVFQALSIGSEGIKQISAKWLLAEPSLTRRELDTAGIPTKIRNTDDAIATLSALIRLLLTGGYSRILIMIDEFQRIGKLRRDVQDGLNAGLHKVFNNCTQGLSLTLSFSFGSVKQVKAHLSPELQDRSDPQTITITALSSADAEIFLGDLLDHAKSSDKPLKINKDVVPTIVHHVARDGSVRARTLVKISSYVLSEAAMDIEDGLMDIVNASHIQEYLDSLDEAQLQDEEEE